MTRARSVAAAAVLALALGLGGCAGSTPEIAAGTSELMQSSVVAAANQVAAGDPTGALATLDALQKQLDQAVTASDVSTERAAAIQQAIDQVRADLKEATAPETITPEPAPETTADTGDDDDKADKGDKTDKPDKPEKPEKNDKGKGKDK